MSDRDRRIEDELATPRSLNRRWWHARRQSTVEDGDEPRRRTAPSRAEQRGEPERRDTFGRAMEAAARATGTPTFLLLLSIFVALWMAWNSVAPLEWRFDSADLGFTALTLVLSLQASYAAPMLLLAQNRQDDRDRVQIEQDRQRAERNTADLEYLARELVALRMLVSDMASKDFIRAELRALLEELDEPAEEAEHVVPTGTGNDADG